MSSTPFYAVIPAGGAGTRLWPVSRSSKPKFLLDLTGGGRTLLQSTVDRLAPLSAGVVVVTGQKHVATVREQLPQFTEQNVFAEPSPRDSMAAIGLAAAVLQRRHGEVIIGSFAADHVITADERFSDAIRQGIAAAEAGYVTTIGIAPDGPATGFGYIEEGRNLGLSAGPEAALAAGFTEKPDEETARGYLATGRYRWNAGMFITKTSVLLDHLARLQPTLHSGLIAIAEVWDTDLRDDVLSQTWPTLTKIAIDHAIAEPVAADGGVATVPGNFDWLDIGDFAVLAEHSSADASGASIAPVLIDSPETRVLSFTDVASSRNASGTASASSATDASGTAGASSPASAPSAASASDATNTTIAANASAQGRAVTVLGVPGIIVVDTPDALLITTADRAQDVKSIVDELRARGQDELL